MLFFTIEHGDRIPPTLKINAGLHLQDRSTATITPDLLQLTDLDTATSNLTYLITLLPRYGKLLLKGTRLPSPPRFFQTDIDHLDLAYRHNPGSPAELDQFYFLPSDGTNKGYLEFGQLREEPAVFNIQVNASYRSAGASISRRFTQQDLDQRSVLYILPVDVNVTADSFQFRLVDPAGNQAPPLM
ncbi:hypothetical protein XENOCAPTIV_014524 [Xenoophorus captivus]|uniref:Uncharacterized protein n=1 Tax=Xenoophorus captivus TaxID=1517983 RepID=A0ABV0RYQ5_9TELE